MNIHAYRMQIDGFFWILLVDTAKFDEIPDDQRQHRWEPVGEIELGPSSSQSALNATTDLKAAGYVVVRGSIGLETLN